MLRRIVRSPVEPPATTAWGWSDLVARVSTRAEAVATISLFTCMRDTLAESPAWWRLAADHLPDVTPDEWRRITAHSADSLDDRAGLLMRALKRIALDPVKRADALLALDVHIAYLRAEFCFGEGDEHGRAA